MSVHTTYRQGRTEFDARAFTDYVVRKVVKYSDADASAYTVRIPIDPGRWLLGVRLHTKTAFSGGSPTVKVGDSADDDGFVKTTDLDITTLNTCVDSRGLATFTANTLPTFTAGTDTFTSNDPAGTDTFAQGADAFTAGTQAALALNAYAKGGKFYAAPNYLLLTFSAALAAGELVVEMIFDGYEDAPRDMVVNQ